MAEDIVAKLPDELVAIQHQTGALPDDVELEPGYFCKWHGRSFIHARATLPLKDFQDGIGFGLWVEVSATDLDAYLAGENDDTLYKKFSAEGKLANTWPGFEDVSGTKVTLRTVFANEKVYITEVFPAENADPLFRVALLTQKDDVEGKKRLAKLVHAALST